MVECEVVVSTIIRKVDCLLGLAHCTPGSGVSSRGNFMLHHGNVYAFAHVASAAFAHSGSGTVQAWLRHGSGLLTHPIHASH